MNYIQMLASGEESSLEIMSRVQVNNHSPLKVFEVGVDDDSSDHILKSSFEKDSLEGI